MKSANGVGAAIDVCVDDSTRGRLVAALTDGLRQLLAEGDGEGARVVLRSLGDFAGLVQREPSTQFTRGERMRHAAPERDEGEGELPNVTSIERALKGGKTRR